MLPPSHISPHSFAIFSKNLTKAANHPVTVTKCQRQAAAAVPYRLIDMKMFVAREERVGMIQPVRVRHPPEPPRDGPVIQAVHQILPVLGPETAK